MFYRITYFFTFSLENTRKKCLMLQFYAFKYIMRVHNSSPGKYIHFIQLKGFRLDVSQVNSFTTHYLIEDWFRLHG